MKRLLLVVNLALVVAFGQPASAQKKSAKQEEVVEMSGISIIGNRELPKTLFIVPWKNSEVGVETELTNTLNEGMRPLDRDVFTRELEYYESTHGLK